MADARAIVSVHEEGSAHVIGTFGAPLLGEVLPRAGELLSVGNLMGRVQDVIWQFTSEGSLRRADVWLPPQRAHVGDRSILDALREDGFVPLDENGDPTSWDGLMEMVEAAVAELPDHEEFSDA